MELVKVRRQARTDRRRTRWHRFHQKKESRCIDPDEECNVVFWADSKQGNSDNMFLSEGELPYPETTEAFNCMPSAGLGLSNELVTHGPTEKIQEHIQSFNNNNRLNKTQPPSKMLRKKTTKLHSKPLRKVDTNRRR